jgi:hypothetical protein
MQTTAIVSAIRRTVLFRGYNQTKESVQSDDQVTTVPAAHAKRQSNQDTLNWAKRRRREMS